MYFSCLLVCKKYLCASQVVIVDGQNGENAATEDDQTENVQLNKEGDDETAKMNEYALLCLKD